MSSFLDLYTPDPEKVAYFRERNQKRYEDQGKRLEDAGVLVRADMTMDEAFEVLAKQRVYFATRRLEVLNPRGKGR